MKYEWILFDADETLFSFNSYLGLKPLLSRYGVEFSEEDYAAFQAVNKPLWIEYQEKKISAKELQTRRFAHLSALTGQDPLVLNQELMAQMALVSTPLEGVMDMLSALAGKVKMGIITNGFHALQQKRLENTKMTDFFEMVVVSEVVGAAKPAPEIFEYAFERIEDLNKRSVLMVGDTLTSDILGGNQVGIDTCWFNPQQQLNDTTIQPTYEIQHIRQLVEIASGRF